MPCFQAHEWTPPSSSPPGSESSFAMCHVSELTNPLLPLSPLQQVGWLIHYPHGRPQCAQCALVHQYVAPSTHPSIRPHRNLLSPGQLESTTLHAHHMMQIDKYLQNYRMILPAFYTPSQLSVRFHADTLLAYIDTKSASFLLLY